MLKFLRTNKPTNGQTDKWTDGQTDGPKTICPDLSIRKHKRHKLIKQGFKGRYIKSNMDISRAFKFNFFGGKNLNLYTPIPFVSRQPVHISMLSWSTFLPVLNRMFFSSSWLLSQITIRESTVSGERGMNPVAMTIINPWKKSGLSFHAFQ